MRPAANLDVDAQASVDPILVLGMPGYRLVSENSAAQTYLRSHSGSLCLGLLGVPGLDTGTPGSRGPVGRACGDGDVPFVMALDRIIHRPLPGPGVFAFRSGAEQDGGRSFETLVFHARRAAKDHHDLGVQGQLLVRLLPLPMNVFGLFVREIKSSSSHNGLSTASAIRVRAASEEVLSERIFSPQSLLHRRSGENRLPRCRWDSQVLLDIVSPLVLEAVRNDVALRFLSLLGDDVGRQQYLRARMTLAQLEAQDAKASQGGSPSGSMAGEEFGSSHRLLGRFLKQIELWDRVQLLEAAELMKHVRPERGALTATRYELQEMLASQAIGSYAAEGRLADLGKVVSHINGKALSHGVRGLAGQSVHG
jgi:hypothetical protein